GAFAGRTEGFSDGTVVGSARLDRGKALPAHGRGKALWDQDVTRIGGVDSPPRAASAGLLLARVSLAMAPAIGPRRARVVPQVVSGHPRRPPPLQVAPVETRVRTNRPA